MADWGFDFVRIPMAYPSYLDIDRSSNIEPEDVDRVSEKALEKVEDLVYKKPVYTLNKEENKYEIAYRKPEVVMKGSKVLLPRMYSRDAMHRQAYQEFGTINNLENPSFLDNMEFLSPVPTQWDETRVLKAQVGDYLVMARKRGDVWWLGGMTDWEARIFNLDLSFLPEGEYDLLLFQDGINADRCAEDYLKVEKRVKSGQTLKQKLAPGGGFAARLTRAKSD